jgi:hypothetical protein
MNSDLSMLDIIAGRLTVALQAARTAQALAATEAADTIREPAREAAENVSAALLLLKELGATPYAPDAGTESLARLSALRTPESEQLALLLQAARDLAEQVDAQRGDTVPETVPVPPDETRGTGWAEEIGRLSRRLNTEVFGPSGK